jgi:hypothetical protein
VQDKNKKDKRRKNAKELPLTSIYESAPSPLESRFTVSQFDSGRSFVNSLTPPKVVLGGEAWISGINHHNRS